MFIRNGKVFTLTHKDCYLEQQYIDKRALSGV